MSDGWISVKERLPEPQKLVLISWNDGRGDMFVALMGDGGEWVDNVEYGGFTKNPTHWRELPAPSKEEA